MKCLLAGILAWFVLDTSLSIFYGVYFNFVFNSTLLILSMLPLVFTRKRLSMKSRLFFITYLGANLGLVLYGALVLLAPSILLDSFLLHVYPFPADATRATAYLAALFRLLGFFNVLPGMLGLLLLRQLMLSWQSWILRVLVASTALAYLGPITFDNTVGSIGFFEIIEHILFALVILFGVILWGEEG